jgi:hypothetical protein
VWIVGSMSTLKSSGDRNWAALFDSAERRAMIKLPGKDHRLQAGLYQASKVKGKISKKFIASTVTGVWQVRTHTHTHCKSYQDWEWGLH